MKPRKYESHTESANIDSWLMSYADMITLLLCFFVIFVSVSEPKKDKFEAVTQGLANQFGNVTIATPFTGAVSALEGVVEQNHAFKDVAIEKGEHSVWAEISSKTFFKPDSAELNEKETQILSEMVEALKKASFMDYTITVEGFTSDVQPQSATYPSNWELSSIRAARIARFLMEHGIPADHLRAIGYGDTKPKVPNLDSRGKPIPENRDKNDRMVIRLERVL